MTPSCINVALNQGFVTVVQELSVFIYCLNYQASLLFCLPLGYKRKICAVRNSEAQQFRHMTKSNFLFLNHQLPKSFFIRGNRK